MSAHVGASCSHARTARLPRAARATRLPRPLPLASPTAVELPIGTKVSLGRRTSPHLNNLHISREQVNFELKPDVSGHILICMTNVRRRVGGAGRPVVGRCPLAATPPPTRPETLICAVARSVARTARAC